MTNITVRGLPELQRKLSSLGQRLRGVQGRVGNNTRYAPLVGSARFQRPVHRRTGWPRDADVMQRRLPQIERWFSEAVDDALEAASVGENPLVAPMHKSVLAIQADMSDYPPKPARSTYRRTGTYGRRFTSKVTEK